MRFLVSSFDMTEWIPEPIEKRISSPPIPCPALDHILDQPDQEQSLLDSLLESNDARANREITHLQLNAFKQLEEYYKDLIINIERFISNHPHIPLARIQREANEQLHRSVRKIRQETAQKIIAVREDQRARDGGIYRHFEENPPVHPPLTPPFQKPLHNPFQIRISSDPKTGGMGWQI